MAASTVSDIVVSNTSHDSPSVDTWMEGHRGHKNKLVTSLVIALWWHAHFAHHSLLTA